MSGNEKSTKQMIGCFKDRLIGIARNPQTSHEKRSNKSTHYYFLIGEQTGHFPAIFWVSLIRRESYTSDQGQVFWEEVWSPNRLVHFLLDAFVA